MAGRIFTYLFLSFACMCISKKMWSNSNHSEERIFVTMRMIGHELLLASGDSTSRVLPVTKEDDRYKIRFASSFSFDPRLLTSIVDSIVEESRVASSYRVEVKDCDSGKVVYSYEVSHEDQGNSMHCFGRIQPEGCYFVLMRIITPVFPSAEIYSHSTGSGLALNAEQYRSASTPEILFYVFIGSVLSLLIFLRIKKRRLKKGSHLISIGSYFFDHKNMSLLKGDEKQELTGKETDLLQLLYMHLNSTVDREVILKEVWRDEGAYIGRTLDVYISKLRKKFESDPTISFINVRGVGYKMTLE